MNWPVDFTSAAWLFLLLLVPLLWWIERHSLALLPTVRRRWALALRSSAIVLLVLALAGIRIERPSDRIAVIFAIDRSASVTEDEAAKAVALVNASLGERRAKDLAGVVVFGEEALVEEPPGPLQQLTSLVSVPGRGFSDVGAAIRLASGLFPEGAQRRLVLFSDGNENLGASASDARSAAANGITIDTVPLTPATNDEVLVEGMEIPESVEKDKPFEARIAVRSTWAGPATLRVYRNGRIAGQTEVTLSEGKNIFLYPGKIDEAGFHTYEAMLDTPRDTIRDNNMAEGHTLVAGESKVLLVGNSEDTALLREALDAEEVPVEVRRDVPVAATDAENFDAIFLVNVPGEVMTLDQMKLLRGYTGDLGGGLAMVGGQNSFGLGGYAGTPVEEALPLRMELRDKKKFPTLGLIILVDKSGSMSGTLPGSSQTKLELAAEAGVAALGQLTDRDHLGTVGFDSAAKWDVPFLPAKHRDEAARGLRSMRPGGGTDAVPAFNEAIRALGGSRLQLKHIILISDGMVQPGDFDGILARCREAGITVTAVGVGTDADRSFMESVAAGSGGRAYFTADPTAVPRIFTKEAVIAQRAYLVEETFAPKLGQPSGITRGLDAAPQLHGYVVTEAKDRAEILLQTHKDDPLLASWRFRSGKGLAWTSDARPMWSRDWAGWTGFRKFWGQGARWVMRSRKEGVLSPRISIEGGKGRIIVEAADPEGRFVNFLSLEAGVLRPDMESERVTLRQVGAGRYEGEFDARATGNYLTMVSGDGVDAATAGASVSYPEEFRASRPNHLLLSQIAAAAGGRMNPAPASFFRLEGGRVSTATDTWYHLLWVALLLFLCDIAVRRLTLDQEHMAQVRAAFARLVPFRQPAGAGTAEGAAATLGALRDRSRQVREKRAEISAASMPTAEAKTTETWDRLPPDQMPAGQESAAAAPPVRRPEKSPASDVNPEENSYTSRLLEARRKARERKGRTAD